MSDIIIEKDPEVTNEPKSNSSTIAIIVVTVLLVLLAIFFLPTLINSARTNTDNTPALSAPTAEMNTPTSPQ